MKCKYIYKFIFSILIKAKIILLFNIELQQFMVVFIF